MNPADAAFCAAPDCADRLWPDAAPPHEPLLDDHRPQSERVRVLPQRGGLHIAVDTSSLAVEPGESVCTTVLVRNTGTQNDTVTVTVEGSAREWASVEPENFTVLPETEVEATVRFTPPHAPSSAAGPRWYSVRVSSGAHPGIGDTAEGTLAVGAFRGVDAELVPRETRGRRRRSVHAVRVTNAGNVHEQVALEAGNDDESLVFTLPAEEVAVAPGAVATVDLQVRAPRRWVGRPQSHPFHVTAVPQGSLQPERLDGKRVVLPLLPTWAGLAAAAVALAAVAALVLRPILFPTTSAEAAPGNASVSGPQSPGGAGGGPGDKPPEAKPSEAKPPDTKPSAKAPEAPQAPHTTAQPPKTPSPPPKPADVPVTPVASSSAAPTTVPPTTTTTTPPTTQPPPAVVPPAPVVTTSAEPPPVVVSTGTVEVASGTSIDLDRGVVPERLEDADLEFRAPVEGTGAVLAPREDTKVAEGTVAVGVPTPDLCVDRPPSPDPVRVADLTTGSVLCVQTDLGHLAVLQIERLPATSEDSYAITYATYEKKP